MTSTSTTGPTWKDWLPAIATAIMVFGIAMTCGSYVTQLTDHTRRLDALERLVDRRDEQLRTIDLRLTRIEAKLEMMIPPGKAVK